MVKPWTRWFAATTTTALMLSMGAVANATDADPLTAVNNTAPTAVTQDATSEGALDTSTLMQASIVLKIQNEPMLAALIKQQTDPQSPLFRNYLSVGQFRHLFAPSPSVVNLIQHYLQSYGLTTSVYPDGLIIHADGTAAEFNNAFNTQLLNLQFKGHSFHGPKSQPKVPTSIGDILLGVAGLTNFEVAHSQIVRLPKAIGLQAQDGTTPVPGALGPQDLESTYDVTPLMQGPLGHGQTIAIATFAPLNPSDAYTFWNTLGIPVRPDRITETPVDGGSGVPVSFAAGSDETSLDVEYSGALAPNAKIDVYEAPNSDYGAIDLYYSIVSDNRAQEFSTSWGFSEDFSDPSYSEMQNQAFEEGAAQGISGFAAAGDSGAYDAYSQDNTDTTLNIDSPADSPYITAAGGTTLPNPLGVTTERAWAWDYLVPFLETKDGLTAAQALSILQYVGTGGGASHFFTEPDDQENVQSTGWRTIPDLAMNADPVTGYNMYLSASDAATTGAVQGWNEYGGTSFVAPQLAGITALINSDKHIQVGFLNPQLYRFASSASAYGQANSPFRDITTGDNWYYNAGAGYDEATGIGTPDVANLASLLAQGDNTN